MNAKEMLEFYVKDPYIQTYSKRVLDIAKGIAHTAQEGKCKKPNECRYEKYSRLRLSQV
ncbi:hypothetical protein [Cellulosilyticum ruminicola]|uniref:hypothetical protein n=1 Tax=Cellulosilyticum ruminicola TaxID=425254 RepID=UPI0012EE1CD3|nr:hypothetical protein [Cellulosilyticum ruminicola]